MGKTIDVAELQELLAHLEDQRDKHLRETLESSGIEALLQSVACARTFDTVAKDLRNIITQEPTHE